MRNLDWIKDLAESELRMEETGIIDLSSVHDENRDAQSRTNEFLKELKDLFIEYTTAFNSLKNSTLGGVKIYGISNTVCDFMLFRNGYKLIFTAAAPGRVAISFQAQGVPFMSLPNGLQSPVNEDLLEANYGPFGELTWTYKGAQIHAENLVRYYLSRFIRESAK